MKRLLLSILFSLVTLSASADFAVRWNFQDFTQTVQTNRRVYLTPIWTVNVAGTNILTPDPRQYTNDSTGSLIVSNFPSEITAAYRVEFQGARATTMFTNVFPTNLSGVVDAKDYISGTVPTNLLTSVYSQAAANARFQLITSGVSTNEALYGSVKLLGAATPGQVWTATNANGAGNWSNSAAGSSVSTNGFIAQAQADQAATNAQNGAKAYTDAVGSSGRMIYVAPWGDDTTGTGTLANPFRTVFDLLEITNKTYRGARTVAAAGDTVVLTPDIHRLAVIPRMDNVNLWIQPGAVLIRTNFANATYAGASSNVTATLLTLGPLIQPGENSVCDWSGATVIDTNDFWGAVFGWNEGSVPAGYGVTNQAANNAKVFPGVCVGSSDVFYFSKESTAWVTNFIYRGSLFSSWDCFYWNSNTVIKTYAVFAESDGANPGLFARGVWQVGGIWWDYGSSFKTRGATDNTSLFIDAADAFVFLSGTQLDRTGDGYDVLGSGTVQGFYSVAGTNVSARVASHAGGIGTLQANSLFVTNDIRTTSGAFHGTVGASNIVGQISSANLSSNIVEIPDASWNARPAGNAVFPIWNDADQEFQFTTNFAAGGISGVLPSASLIGAIRTNDSSGGVVFNRGTTNLALGNITMAGASGTITAPTIEAVTVARTSANLSVGRSSFTWLFGATEITGPTANNNAAACIVADTQGLNPTGSTLNGVTMRSNSLIASTLTASNSISARTISGYFVVATNAPPSGFTHGLIVTNSYGEAFQLGGNKL